MPSKVCKKVKQTKTEWNMSNLNDIYEMLTFQVDVYKTLIFQNDCSKFHYSPIKLKFDKQGLLFLWFKILLFCYNFEFLFVNMKYKQTPNKPCGPGIYMTLYKRSKKPSKTNKKYGCGSFKFYMDWYLSNYVRSNCFFFLIIFCKTTNAARL